MRGRRRGEITYSPLASSNQKPGILLRFIFRQLYIASTRPHAIIDRAAWASFKVMFLNARWTGRGWQDKPSRTAVPIKCGGLRVSGTCTLVSDRPHEMTPLFFNIAFYLVTSWIKATPLNWLNYCTLNAPREHQLGPLIRKVNGRPRC